MEAIARRLERERASRLAKAEDARRVAADAIRATISKGLQERVAATVTLAGDEAAIRDGAVSALAGLRSELERIVLTNAFDAPAAELPFRAMSQDDASRLGVLLDEYEAGAARVDFPFLHDPELLSVGTPLSPVEAAGIALTDRRTDAVDRLRKAILDAERTSESSAVEWPTVRSSVVELKPLDFLAGLIEAAVSPGRSSTLISELDASSIGEALRKAGVTALLDRLNIDELIFIEALSRGRLSWVPDALLATKIDLHDAIRANIGLVALPGPIDEKALDSQEARMVASTKVRNSKFDVFLAHNSADRTAVIDLGFILRGHGINPWIDIEQIPPGRWFQDVIQSAAREVKSVAIVIGEKGLGRWQAMELRTFISRCVEDALPVIPVLLPGVRTVPENLLFLRELNSVAFERAITEGPAILRLVWGITGVRPAGAARPEWG